MSPVFVALVIAFIRTGPFLILAFYANLTRRHAA
jgi:hypothetical protein